MRRVPGYTERSPSERLWGFKTEEFVMNGGSDRPFGTGPKYPGYMCLFLQPQGPRCLLTWVHTGPYHWRRGGWACFPPWLHGGRTSWTPQCKCPVPRGTPQDGHLEWSSCCLRTPAVGLSSAAGGIWWLCSPKRKARNGNDRQERRRKEDHPQKQKIWYLCMYVCVYLNYWCGTYHQQWNTQVYYVF